MNDSLFIKNIKKYRFEFKHLTVLFATLIAFQIVLSFIHKFSLQGFLVKTQEWYQRDSAERLANITTTSLELIVETINSKESLDNNDKRKIIQAFNIILSQQVLQQNVQDISLIISKGDETYAIDDGEELFSFLYYNVIPEKKKINAETLKLYKKIKSEISSTEQIYSLLEGQQTFHIFVPFIFRGEYLGALYIKNTPDFSFMTQEIINSYDETVIIFSSLIFLGLLAMYYISSYTVKERDEAQEQLFDEHEKNIKKQIVYEKEGLFTKRIYHTHHKAEKIMGFIKEDLLQLSPENIDEIKYRITRYSNFISRVIYDMKWFDPPVQTIRNPFFNTDLNELIRFIVNHTFLRNSSDAGTYEFILELDENMPKVHINEFVIWEIIEPLIQNSIEHGGENKLKIILKTEHNSLSGESKVIIRDNGLGIRSDLLEISKEGVKRLFLENISTKKESGRNKGYGCFLAYTIAKDRCGWMLDAENIPDGGCQFTISFINK